MTLAKGRNRTLWEGEGKACETSFPVNDRKTTPVI